MDAARSVVPQTGVEAEDKQRRLIWDPTADAKQISPSRHKMSPGSHARTYQRVQVDVGPLNLLGLPVVLHHGPAQNVQVLLRFGLGRGQIRALHHSATRGSNTQESCERTWVLILMAPMDGIS